MKYKKGDFILYYHTPPIQVIFQVKRIDSYSYIVKPVYAEHYNYVDDSWRIGYADEYGAPLTEIDLAKLRLNGRLSAATYRQGLEILKSISV